MKIIGNLTIILIIVIMFLLAGCGDNNTQSTTSSTQSTNTTSVTETIVVEKGYELSGNETYGLLALYELEVTTKKKEITISAVLSSVRISRADVFVVGEFYNAAGEMVYTNDSNYILDSSQTIRSIGVGITYYTDDPSVVTMCKLIISAHE